MTIEELIVSIKDSIKENDRTFEKSRNYLIKLGLSASTTTYIKILRLLGDETEDF